VDEAAARRSLVQAVRWLDERGLNVNASGNVSVRLGDGLLVTPSGIPAGELTEADGVVVDLDGRPRDAHGRIPTSEWRLHTEVLRRRPEVGAIVHTHSPEATAAATLRAPVPAVHYVVARFGGPVLPCAPYATYGSAELAGHVAATLGAAGMACLMANHGAVALGRDLASACTLALDVEWFCGVHRRARQLGAPVVLDDAEVARVATLFRTYGQPPGDVPAT
jgi:L-fuculose-phosphate aldolase